MDDQFQPHQRPNRSRLEQWRSEITKMRAVNWPYEKIAGWLLEKQNCRISAQAIHQFCKRRGISTTGNVATAVHSSRKQMARPTATPSQVFDFDDTAPIERWPEPVSDGTQS